jgi:uncharacterized protein (TIGR02266 family)
MTHPADTARKHIAEGLEACQADPELAETLETLARNLAQAQGKLFPAAKVPPDSPAAVDLMRRAMEYLAQGLKVLQDIHGGGELVDKASQSIALAIKALHPVVQQTKREAERRSLIPPPRSAHGQRKRDAIPINISTMLNIDTDHHFYNGFSENIEEGGIFVATFDPKPVDAQVVVNFKLPGGVPITAQGVVHFVREYNPLSPSTAPGMGVKFTHLLEKDKKAIESYLEMRAPIFYDDGK